MLVVCSRRPSGVRVLLELARAPVKSKVSGLDQSSPACSPEYGSSTFLARSRRHLVVPGMLKDEPRPR